MAGPDLLDAGAEMDLDALSPRAPWRRSRGRSSENGLQQRVAEVEQVDPRRRWRRSCGTRRGP